MGQLGRRVERLEGISRPSSPPCGRCGTGSGRVALLGLPDDGPVPGWVGADGHCLECGRFVRVYRGIDMALV